METGHRYEEFYQGKRRRVPRASRSVDLGFDGRLGAGRGQDEPIAPAGIEALKEQKTANEIASAHGVHPVMVSQWKKTALEAIKTGFDGPRAKKVEEQDGFGRDQLLSQIGQLKVELDWLKKKV